MFYEFKRQDAYDFAEFVHIKAKDHGNELQFETCPYCKGGAKHDKWTFAINRDNGAYNCKRATCGVSGNMFSLAKDFGFSLGNEFDEYMYRKKQFRSLPTPKTPIIPKDPAIKYLQSRGISEATARKYEITVQNGHDNVLVFPFYDENGHLQFVKYRKTDFDKSKDKAKEWCEAHCRPILFGMKQCTEDRSRLVITEGQCDSLAVSEAGIDNAVSVPTGAKGFTWIPYCWDWVNQFDEIVVFGDHENGHVTLLDDIKRRFKMRIKVVREDDYLGCKDANEILLKHGAEAVRKAVENAELLPTRWTIDIADVETVDVFEIPKLRTGLVEVDRTLYGGLPFGGVTLITGKPGEGKLLADGTMVFTSKGWKRHGDLKVGDEVVGRYGKFVKVTHVFPKAYANMRVTLNNHEVIYCHENHEWVTNFHSGNGYRERIMTAKEIMEWKARTSCHPARLISRDPLDGNPIALAVRPYTLGAWLGDGRNTNPDICSSEQDLSVIKRIWQDGYEQSWHTVHKDTGVLYFGIKGLRKGLQAYGMCHSRKSVEKYIPNDYLIAPLNDRLQLLAGLLDTDGYYDKVKGEYTFATTSINLKETFCDLIHTFGWNCHCRTIKAHASSSGVLGKRDVYYIGFVPIGLEIPCVVERKHQHIIKPYSKRRTAISKIEYCEPIPGNCIEVEGGVYCVGKTMIPTHNSTLASQIIIHAMQQGYRCFAYSGELTNSNFKDGLFRQIAGSNHIETYQNQWYENQYKISDTNRHLLAEWCRGKLALFTEDNISDESSETVELVKIVETEIMQHDTKVFLIDNLMTALDLDGSAAFDRYDKQSMFCKRLARIARNKNVLFILVAHKRKNNFSANTNDEIAGSGDIANLGTVVLSYEKDYGNEIDETQRKLKITKNRLFGRVNTEGWVYNFDEKSKRIYSKTEELREEFGWGADQADVFTDAEDEGMVFD